MAFKLSYTLAIQTTLSANEADEVVKQNITVVDSFFSTAASTSVKNMLSDDYREYYGKATASGYLVSKKSVTQWSALAKPRIKISNNVSGGLVKISFSPKDYEAAGGLLALVFLGFGLLTTGVEDLSFGNLFGLIFIFSLFPLWIQSYKKECAASAKFFTEKFEGKTTKTKWKK